MLKARIGMMAAGVVAAAGLVFGVSTATAETDIPGIKKIAEAVKKGDMAGAKKLAAAYAKANTDVEDLMAAFKPGKKGGIGVGGTDQGIEQTLNKIGRDAPTAANMGKMADAYMDMGYNIAAVGLISEALAPQKDNGKKTKKTWVDSSTGMVEAGLKLVEAAKTKTAADLKTHAVRANNNCGSCHAAFKQ